MKKKMSRVVGFLNVKSVFLVSKGEKDDLSGLGSINCVESIGARVPHKNTEIYFEIVDHGRHYPINGVSNRNGTVIRFDTSSLPKRLQPKCRGGKVKVSIDHFLFAYDL